VTFSWFKKRVRRLASGAGVSGARPHFFVTVDAESEVIADGIRTISAIRDRVEREAAVEIPIVWFVRFQRSWTEYVKIDSPPYFSGPVTECFDGFALAAAELRRLRARRDEIGWHYHAYSYVHRDDLSHAHKLAILHADLAACAAEIRRRHGEYAVQSLRFGWFFIPDYDLFATLRASGIRIDASVHPAEEGKQVASFQATYLPPITRSPRAVNGTWFFPFVRTSLLHDWTVVPHDFGWRSQSEPESARNGELFETKLRRRAGELREAGGAFLTYERLLAARGR
jgi:hypothetical protein